jgi:Tat protein secretion system quality control protein TatD with DNase activity
MEIKYIDIHSHLNLSPLWEKREEVIARMREKGVGTIVIGVDKETSKRAVGLAISYPDVVLDATVGLHPTDNDKEVFDMGAYTELAVQVFEQKSLQQKLHCTRKMT